MPEQTLKARHGVPLRLDPGVALTAADRPLPLTGLQGHRRAIVHIMQEANLALAAGDEVRFLIETAYGTGDFAASGELLDEAAGIDDTQRTITVDDASTFVPGDVIRLDQEWMLVTARDEVADTLTVVRGHENTPRAAHANNAPINLLDVDWITVANILYDNADDASSPEALIVIGNTGTAPAIFDDLDAALADNTILAAPLGDRLRLRTTITLTPGYRYSARVSLQN